MKKEYQKPSVEAESFRLTQHIASCTGTKISSLSIACVMNDPDSKVVLQSLAAQGYFMDVQGHGCFQMPVDNGTGDDGLCYFTSTNAVFNS